jgi:glycosyltransferase involved in cell wall biosynthesis
MKTVMFISPSPSVKGGISTVIKDYLSTVLQKRHRIILISSHKDGTKIFKLLVAISGIIIAFFTLVFRRIDIVHIHGSDSVSFKRKYLFYRVARLFSCKIIYHFHGASFMEKYPILSDFWKRRFREVFEGADLVVCLSRSWKNNILSIAPASQVQIVPNAIRLPAIDKGRKRADALLQLTFLGYIGDRKGIFDLLKVVKRLTSEGMNLQLNVGGNGEVNRLINEIDSLGLRNKVEFLGWASPEIRDVLYRKTDIFVLPSYGEGMPMTILEAMSYGVPVISTPVGGIPELIIDNETGFLVRPGDLEGLYDKIIDLANNEEKRNSFGVRGRQVIEQKHNIVNTIGMIDEIYRAL